jgi:hypothetical protein
MNHKHVVRIKLDIYVFFNFLFFVSFDLLILNTPLVISNSY